VHLNNCLRKASSHMPEHVAQTLLNQAHPSAVAATIFTDKVLHKPLRLRPSSPDPNSKDARAKRRLQRLHKKERLQRRQKPKPLSAKEKRITGIYDILDNARKYEIYVPLHKMWLGYMWEILGMKEGEDSFITAQSAGSKLGSADYHGADIRVVRSRCVGMVGLAGIVVKDTKFTFQVITKKDELKSARLLQQSKLAHERLLTCFPAIPKRHTVFQFDIPQPRSNREQIQGSQDITERDVEIQPHALVFELHGSQFEIRPTDRATKKLKQRRMDDL